MDKKAKARVAIAFDVLQNVDSLKVDNRGWYLADTTGKAPQYDPYGNLAKRKIHPYKGNLKDDASKHIPKLQKCQVCALGACLISQVKLFNKLPLGELVNYGGGIDPTRDMVSGILSRFFSKDQLDLIEVAFEAISEYDGGVQKKECHLDAERFGMEYSNPKKRLKAIMGNIIVNDGEFCP